MTLYQPLVFAYVMFPYSNAHLCSEVIRVLFEGRKCISSLLLYTGRSPLFGHFSTTLLGLDTIRAYGVEETFTDQVNSYQDAHSRAWFSYLAGQTWLNFRLEMLTVLFLAFVAFVSPAIKGSK